MPNTCLPPGITEAISTWSKEGDQIIVAGNLNEHINSKKVESYFAKIGLRELISEKHSKKVPATTRKNRNNKVVDGIWRTKGLSIEKGGYLLYHMGIKLDNRLIWFKISTSVALGSQLSRS